MLLTETPSVQKFKTKKDYSFAGRMKEGWTKEQLMKYYGLTEDQYNRAVESLERIRAGVKK